MTPHTTDEIREILTESSTFPVISINNLPSDDEFTVAIAKPEGVEIWGVCNGFEIQDLSITWADIIKQAPMAALIEELENRPGEDVDTFRLHGDEEFSYSFFGIHCEIGNTVREPAVILVIPDGGV